jgi:hypothetical protein
MPTSINPKEVEWEEINPTEVQWEREQELQQFTAPFPTEKIPFEQPRTFLEQTISEFKEPTNIGGMAGGIAGGIIGGPPGAIGGAAGGGFLASVMQDQYNLLKSYVDYWKIKQTRPDLMEISQLPGVDVDVMEILKEGGISALEQAIYEAIPEAGIGAVHAAGARPLFKKLTGKVYEETGKVLKTLPRLGRKKNILPILPHEATQGTLLDIAHNVSAYSLLGSHRIVDWYIPMRERAINDMVDAIADEMGTKISREQIGQYVVDTVFRRKNIRAAAIKPIDDALSPLMRGKSANLSEVKRFFEPFEKELERGVAEYPESFERVIAKARNKPDAGLWSDVKLWRSQIDREISAANFQLGTDDITIGHLRKARKMLTKILREGAEDVGGDAPILWRAYNETYAKKSRELNRRFVKRLFDQIKKNETPHLAADRIFQKDALENIRGIKKLFGEGSQEFSDLRRWYFQKTISESSGKVGEREILQGEKLFDNLLGKNSLGEDYLKELYSPKQYDLLKDFSISMQRIAKSEGTGTGRIFIQLSQAGAAMGFFTYGELGGSERSKKTAYIILGGPVVLSRILTNPRFGRAVIEGLNTPRISPRFASNILRTTDMINKENIQESKERVLWRGDYTKKMKDNIWIKTREPERKQ